MFKVVNASDTSRAVAFELWKDAPMPMVTLTKTLDVTRFVRLSRQQGLKFNMLICWCICKAASGIKEFYLLPANGGLLQYDSLAVNVIVANKNGGINNCDIPFDDDFEKFAKDYQVLTECVANDCRDITDESRRLHQSGDRGQAWLQDSQRCGQASKKARKDVSGGLWSQLRILISYH